MKSLLFLALAFLFNVAAQAAPAAAPVAKPIPAYKEGTNYQPVLPAQPTTTPPGQIEVLDFFWYGCPHCNAFEPYLESWERSKPADVVLRRVPAILEPDWEPAARAYYTAEALGLLAKSHMATFNEIHQNNHPLLNEADFQAFFVKQFNVDAKKFADTWASPAVDAKVAQAKVLADRYGLIEFGVPTLVVNGKWITGGGYVPYSQIMLVVNQLIQQEQAAMPPSVK
jgi:thiol:disulfide interchange protein DsbA